MFSATPSHPRVLHLLVGSLMALSVSWSSVSAADTATTAPATPAPVSQDPLATSYHTVTADGVRVFYREAGAPTAPTVLLLHGFGTSSFMFRELMTQLAPHYHLIAPDLPGFGETEVPAERSYRYTFANVATTIGAFTDTLGLKHYALYVFDYGAPTGFRLALAHPERVTAIVSQNGNAYLEGLSDGWNPIRAYWQEPSAANRAALRGFMTLETTRWQYLTGVSDPSRVAPDGYRLAQAGFERPGNVDIQLDLFGDYQSNVALYPAFQAYLRTRQPPLLAVWGKHDPFFLPAGAEAYRRDLPQATVEFVDSGHMALESHGKEIGTSIRRFLDAHLAAQ